MTRMPQGHCTLPADDAGRVLDRLAGLEQVIRPEDIQQALSATGRANSRRCRLTHEIVLWVVLAMGLLTDLPIRQVFKAARRLRKGEASPHRSSLCVARQRLGWRRYGTCSTKSLGPWLTRRRRGRSTATCA